MEAQGTDTGKAAETAQAQGQGQRVQEHAQEQNANGNTWTQGWPGAEELAALRRGVRDFRGDMVVFMPSFVQDPWKDLR